MKIRVEVDAGKDRGFADDDHGVLVRKAHVDGRIRSSYPNRSVCYALVAESDATSASHTHGRTSRDHKDVLHFSSNFLMAYIDGGRPQVL